MSWLKYCKIGYFILGILFIGLAIFTFKNPIIDLTLLVLLFSIVIILKGMFELYSNKSMKEWVGYYSNLIVWIGIIDLLIGVFFFFHLTLGIILLPFIFALWFVFNAGFRWLKILVAKELNVVHRSFLLVINSLGIIIGFFFLFHPTISALTLVFCISLHFLLLGIMNLKLATKKT